MMSVTFDKMSERRVHCIWRYMYFCDNTIYGVDNARPSGAFASSTCLKHANAKQSIIRETNAIYNNVCETRFIHTRRRNCSVYLTNIFLFVVETMTWEMAFTGFAPRKVQTTSANSSAECSDTTVLTMLNCRAVSTVIVCKPELGQTVLGHTFSY